LRSPRLIAIGILALSTALAGAVTTVTTPAHAAVTKTTAPAWFPAPVNYVALGDSYAAGVGNEPYLPSSGSCDRSPESYPVLWAAFHHPASFTDASCTFATISDVISSQLSALKPSTTLVSITAGGDDANFQNLMETCYLSWVESSNGCVNDVASTDASLSASLPGELATLFADIHADSPKAKIVVVGYVDLYDLSVTGCIDLTSADRSALNGGATRLDAILAEAAAQGGATYADPSPEFSGHQLCDPDSWLRDLVITNVLDSFHPDPIGQLFGYAAALNQGAA
jgi:hypothetical protein